MSDPNPTLTRWLRPRSKDLDRATLGQLVTLMNLVGSESVAELERKFARVSDSDLGGVNSRQKLARLEEALGIGKLTVRDGKFTRPTAAGRRVAGELRLFLEELRAISNRKAEVQTWTIGAGEAWLHSVILPALGRLSKSRPEWRWQLQNLRSFEVLSGLREGTLNFGFLRDAEVLPKDQFTVATRVTHEGYRVIVGAAGEAKGDGLALVRWAIEQGRPLAQQGSTWPRLRELLARSKPELGLENLELRIVCESHTQAIAAVEAGEAWCIVPSGLGQNLPAACRSGVIKVRPDEISLAYYSRALRKHAHSDRVAKELADAIRHVARQL